MPSLEDVNCDMPALAHIYRFAEVCMAGVIFAIAEKQDEVASRFRLRGSPPVAASGVQGVKEGGEGIEPIGPGANRRRSKCDRGVLVRPVLGKQGMRVKLHDERLINTFANKTRNVHLDDVPIEVNLFPHGGTDVKQESS